MTWWILCHVSIGLMTPQPDDLKDWTPRPATGKAEPWETLGDPAWDDRRFLDMQAGPIRNATVELPQSTPGGSRKIVKASIVELRNGQQRQGLIFDHLALRTVATWPGGSIEQTNRRYGLMNTVRLPANPQEATLRPAGPAWSDPQGQFDPGPRGRTDSLPPSWARYEGYYRIPDGVTFRYRLGSRLVLQRHRLDAAGRVETTLWADGPVERKAVAELPAVTTFGELQAYTQPAPRRWGEPIRTPFLPGVERNGFTVDTLTLPFTNPFRALMFTFGVDHLPDGRVAVSTAHGDVWLVRLNESQQLCEWTRFATGLYQPLGLRVIQGQIVVLERGQLTRLHDLNQDGEADFYECVNQDWHSGGGEHSYDTGLEVDAAGHFYFLKTGDTQLPHGGCLMKVTADGSRCEVVATGFRHPIGLGLSPTGELSGADQEGNWMPATRIDRYQPGGFYGDMRAHHRATPPITYSPPWCWLPREVDNSAGGQVWVPEKTWGPLAGQALHFSYGRCQAFLLLKQDLPDGRRQGGVWDTGLKFLSGAVRGRFDAQGALWVVGLNGWQTAAAHEGCLQRVRYRADAPVAWPLAMKKVPGALELTFSQPLKPESVTPLNHTQLAAWNYRWSGQYGSKRYRPGQPESVGQDTIPVQEVQLSQDGRTVRILCPACPVPVMNLQVGLNYQSATGQSVRGLLTLTLHGDDPR